MKWFYRLYQIFVAIPVLVISTFFTAIITMAGCTLGSGKFWGYYPAHLWSIIFCRILLLPVKVEGRKNINRKTSYIFVANHQGAMDIFLIFGFLNHKFRWMMKKSLERIPLVGFACVKAHHIFEDHSSPSAINKTIEVAKERLEEGISLAVFPEGTRSSTGKINKFHRGAFLLADKLQIPVVPLTLDGPFDVLNRSRDIDLVERHCLRLVIHKPIYPNGQGRDNINYMTNKAYEIIREDLPEKFK